MTSKEPVLLTVLIQTASLRWYVAAVDLGGDPLPLMRSEDGNLSAYIGAPFDEQVSFLRHRLAGVLQRGFDRLWGRQKKPCQIVFLADDHFPQAAPELTPSVGEHFVQWMVNPPVAFLVAERGGAQDQAASWRLVAGEMENKFQTALAAGLSGLLAMAPQDELWEVAPRRTTS